MPEQKLTYAEVRARFLALRKDHGEQIARNAFLTMPACIITEACFLLDILDGKRQSMPRFPAPETQEELTDEELEAATAPE
jgi:hypothetical protein